MKISRELTNKELNLPCIALRFVARLKSATPRHNKLIHSALGLHDFPLFHRVVKLTNANNTTQLGKKKVAASSRSQAVAPFLSTTSYCSS